MRGAGSYKNAKIWAVKSHLTTHYKYNQQELDILSIVETKRARRGDLIYVAVTDNRDIGDMYARKAECRSDETVIINTFHLNILRDTVLSARFVLTGERKIAD